MPAGVEALAGDIIEFARPAIEYLNGPQNHMGTEDLEWLIHTSPYELWQSQRTHHSALYCWSSSYPQDTSRDSLAASVAQILPEVLRPHKIAESGDLFPVSRSLYFQCLTETQAEFSSKDAQNAAEQPNFSAQHIFVSLIC